MSLSPTKALIFRIIHRDNLPWILDNGLHARSGKIFDPNYRNIGNPELIGKCSQRIVGKSLLGHVERLCPLLFHAIFDHDVKH